jgi:hypothetical protein
MRQQGISWAEGERRFVLYYKDLVAQGEIKVDNTYGAGNRQALFKYIKDNPKDFLWSCARGFMTQFFGGQNAELMHRLQSREIEVRPLPLWLHRLLIALHALVMLVVWALYAAACVSLFKDKKLRPFVVFSVLSVLYFYAAVATLGAPRFRVPVMPLAAMTVGLWFKTLFHQKQQRRTARS